MTLKINKLIYLLLAVFLIVGISGCTDSKSGIFGSSVSSKLAASENSGIFSEKAYPYSSSRYDPCKGMLHQYKAVYNNGDTLDIEWTNEARNTCDNKFYSVNYHIKNPNTNDQIRNEMGVSYYYHMSFDVVGLPTYSGPSGYIYMTTDGRVDPSRATGDINEANEYINLGKNKANEIMNRYNSGQLR